MKTKSNPTIDFKATTSDYFFALLHFPCYTKLLKADNEPYKDLLRWLINYKQNHEEEERFSSLGEVAKKLGISYSSFSMQIKTIYEDIMDLNFDRPELFSLPNQQLYSLSFEYWGNSCYFNMGLDVMPKFGESFSFSFVKPKCDCNMFYVDKIYHEIQNGKQEVTISLISREPNHYLNLLKDKAYLNHEISLMEYCFDQGYKLEEKLLRLYKNL
ncbi:MAG: hypothetical protein IPP32_16480 [Bacteroidetes bacterium]|nr:hypothetical protein [Bacteroidota bacterium]